MKFPLLTLLICIANAYCGMSCNSKIMATIKALSCNNQAPCTEQFMSRLSQALEKSIESDLIRCGDESNCWSIVRDA
jgi:hypothetical protein